MQAYLLIDEIEEDELKEEKLRKWLKTDFEGLMNNLRSDNRGSSIL